MPIYVYRCSHCGHQQDVLQKMSDPRLTHCPACGQETYEKQVTAAGFRLKGSGWYETDFRGGGGSHSEGVLGSSAPSSGASDHAAGTTAGTASATNSKPPASSPAPAASAS
ncbi:FmdB family zinc ribbon protein [Castellaniella caeni]|uniref:FmdB family zinc ribbon protein n=1 Tax=Castellaniella caeni TaxID=266123 RepID=UPI00082A26C8|nr:zinc ribbon domain-containing protein [Castellaniella caeni]